MGSAGPLRLVPGFFGADEALTDYASGRPEWAATLIVAAPTVDEARRRVGDAANELARYETFTLLPEERHHLPTKEDPR